MLDVSAQFEYLEMSVRRSVTKPTKRNFLENYVLKKVALELLGPENLNRLYFYPEGLLSQFDQIRNQII
jgi:hypothetical protein